MTAGSRKGLACPAFPVDSDVDVDLLDFSATFFNFLKRVGFFQNNELFKANVIHTKHDSLVGQPEWCISSRAVTRGPQSDCRHL